MPSETVTSKGQITIPMDVRHRMNVNKGDRVEFIEIGPGRYEFIAATRSMRELKGIFGKPSKKVSIDEMKKAIGRPGAGTA